MDHLASSLDAVEFEPHVTVFCGAATEALARATARTIATQFSKVELAPGRLSQTDAYTKTFFVQFQDSAVAARMSEAARAYSPNSDYVLNPHLSLLYKRLPEAKRIQLCETVDFPNGVYIFDRIRLIETELPIEDAGPVHRWRTVLDEPLLG